MGGLRDEYEGLVVAYTHFVDFGEAGRVAELFSDDGVWDGGADARMEGRDAIARGFGARQARSDRVSRHVCTNLAVHAADDDIADGVAYFTLYRYDGDRRPAPLEGPVMVGEYRDRLVRTPDGWRIRERVAVAAFVRPEAE